MKLVCKHCGSDAGFTEVGSVTCSATCNTHSVERNDADELVVKWRSVDVDTFDHDSLDGDHVACRHCGAEGGDIDDLAVTVASRAATCTCGHVRCEHQDQPFDPKRHSRGLVTCNECACQDFAPARGIEIHPEQARLELAT